MEMKFEKLVVWQLALELSAVVHELTLSFPKDGRYILTPQIKRATDSIALNIAEGSTGQSTPEFKRFLTMAMRSGIEVIACLHIAEKRKIINTEILTKHKTQTQELVKKIFALKNSLK